MKITCDCASDDCALHLSVSSVYWQLAGHHQTN